MTRKCLISPLEENAVALSDMIIKNMVAIKEIIQAGGKLIYIFNVLKIIRDEERLSDSVELMLHPSFKDTLDFIKGIRPQEQSLITNFSSDGYSAITIDDADFDVKKYVNGELVDVNLEDIPEYFVETLREMERHRLHLMVNPFEVEGEIITAHRLKMVYEGEKYVLNYHHTALLCKDIKLSDEKLSKRKGPRGALHSNAAIYLLHKYFHSLWPDRSKRRINTIIAEIVNAYSRKFFRAGDIKAEQLDWDKIRKRIDWIEKEKSEASSKVKAFALKWEKANGV